MIESVTVNGTNSLPLGDAWDRYLATHAVELRDEIIMHHLHLVKYVVGKIGSALPAYIKLDDLYSSGISGLVKAVERFDPTKNSKFETYAILLIKGAIIDELRHLDWIPRSVHQKAQWIASAQDHLQQKLGREPLDAEVATHLGITEDAFCELLLRVRPAILISLDQEFSPHEEENGTLAERIADQRAETSFEAAHRKEYASLLAEEIAHLSEQEQKVLMLYYYEDLILKEIGKVMGISESRVSQIHTKALLRLRRRLGSDHLKDLHISDVC